MRAGRHDKRAKRIEQARRLVPTMIKKDDGTYVPYPTLYRYGILMVGIFTKIVKVYPLEKKRNPLEKRIDKVVPSNGRTS